MRKAFDAGTLNRLIELQEPADTSDGQGGRNRSFTSAGFVWAAFDDGNPREAIRDGRYDGITRHKATIRYFASVRSGWKATEGERSYRVVATADPDGKQRFLTLLLEEKSDE
jgi:SPP1 family predicted phage head-tail adaptor